MFDEDLTWIKEGKEHKAVFLTPHGLFELTMLELCARNRNPEGVTEDPKDWVISISGGRSFAFSFADALELHWT